MMHKGYDSPWLVSNNNSESSNHTNLRQSMQNNNNNNFKVIQEETQGSFQRYEYPDHVNNYTSSTINTASSHHDRMNHQYILQGSHQISSQCSSFYQNSNVFGALLGSQIQQQVPIQTQSTELSYFKSPHPWSHNQNLYNFKNQNVNYSQFYVGNENHKTSDCSNRAQVNETNTSKTPRIRVKDVYSVNNTVYQEMNNLCEPQRKEQTSYLGPHLLNHKRIGDNVMQRPYENIPGVPEYKNLNNNRYEYYELLMNQSGAQPVLINSSHQQSMINCAWVFESAKVNSKTNAGNKNDEVLIASTSDPRQSNIDLGKSLCSKNLEKVSLGNTRMKISKRRCQVRPKVGSNAVNTQSFLENQSNNLKSGFQGSEPHFSLPATLGSCNEVVYSISNTQTPNENQVQRNEAMKIMTTWCDSSTVPTVTSGLCRTDNQYSIAISSGGNNITSYVDNSNKDKANVVHGRLNENPFMTKGKPQYSSDLNDPHIPSAVKTTLAIPVIINGNREEPSLEIDKTNTECHAKSKSGCTEPQEENECLNNQQGENQSFSINNILGEALTNEQSSEINSSVKREACTLEISDSGQKCLTSPFNNEEHPMGMEQSFLYKKSEALTETLCEPHPVVVSGKEKVTSSNENSTHDVPEESCQIEHNYENKINREKLDRLIEFLESGDNSVGCNAEENSLKGTIRSFKRKREDDDALNHNRRKLRNTSIVKNKSKTREMISFILCKPGIKESTSVSEPVCQEENLDNESKVKIKEDEGTKDKTDGRECSTMEQANEELERETKDGKKLSPRSSTKENFEGKKKKRKRKRRSKEKNSKIESEKGTGKNKDSEETGIISTVRAFQKLQYHYCMSCNLNSSNDSFWINVVSGELRCLNCFKKMAMRTEKAALKSKNVLENCVHEPRVLDGNNHANLSHGAEKKREEKNDFPVKIKIKAKEMTTKIPTKQSNEEIKNSDRERKKKSKENHEKHSWDEDNRKGKEKLTGVETFSLKDKQAKKKERKTEFSCVENSNSNPDKTVDKKEGKSKKHKKKDREKDGSEREIDKKGPEKKNVLNKIFETQTESMWKNKQKLKPSKDLVERSPDSKLEEKKKLGGVNSNAESKKKCSGGKKSEETFDKKKRKENARESKGDPMNLLEKLYEKTREVSLSLFGET